MKIILALLLLTATTLTATTLAQQPQLKTGPNADLGGALLMPLNDEWNRDVSKDPVDPLSDAIIASIGADKGLHEDFGVVWNGAPGGIPFKHQRPRSICSSSHWVATAT